MKQGKESFIKVLRDSKGFALDIVIILILSLFSLFAIATLPQGNMIRIILGISFLLFFPGYSLVSFLWPKKKGIDGLERIALSFGLSIAIVPIIGLVLNYTTWGIDLYPLMFSIFILIFVSSCAAYFRRIKVPIEERFVPSFLINKLLFSPRSEKAFVTLIIILFVLALSIFIYVVLTPTISSPKTTFYLLDENGSADPNALPKNLTVGEEATVIIGVLSQESKTTNYIIEVMLQNATENTNITINQYNFSLENNQENETLFTFTVQEIGEYKLQFLLYKVENGEKVLIRELHLWLYVT